MATKSKYVTGFCANGQHEGTKPKSKSGTPLKICDAIDLCKCKCHAEVSELYAMAEEPRALPEQTHEYNEWVHAQRIQFIAPSIYGMLDSSGLSSPVAPDPRPTSSDTPVAPDVPAYAPLDAEPAVVQPVFHATPTGRRAKGQLELDVLEICRDFLNDVYEWDYCTPKNVAERVASKYAIEPPSTGAVSAVWDRWEAIGFATQAKKPSRFESFVVKGDITTLTLLKTKKKRDKKRSVLEARRDLRPVRK